jgi:aspartate/methionine/tyrosine aminotransferase
MKIPIFELERVQSVYENTVDYNLTESGFHPYKLSEVLNKDQLSELQELSLGYGQTNGSPSLRNRIASLYPNCAIDNILVTNGSAEANFVVCHTLLEAGDEVVMMVPNYMQIWGIAEEMGCKLARFPLREEKGWAPDLSELRSLVYENTKMIALCNPDNPTGYVLTNDEMDEIIAIAKTADAWIYCDEIYNGAELNGVPLRSFYDRYDKVLVNGGLSKAYALPGLRLGWLTGPADIIENAWAYHDYTSICSTTMSQYVAEIVLAPENRNKILSRNRKMLSENLQSVTKWLDQYESVFSYHPPQSGGMLYVHYKIDISSTELAEWLRKEKSVFILAGDCFGMDKYFRLGIGASHDYLMEGLHRFEEGLAEKFGIYPTQQRN